MSYSRGFNENLLYCPHFYQVQKNGRTSYILGTRHDKLLSVLPSAFFNFIRQAKSLVTEVILSIRLNEKQLHEIGILTDHQQAPGWFDRLDPSLQPTFSNIVINFFQTRTNMDFPGYDKINYEMAYLIISLGNRSDLWMDKELEHLFHGKVHHELEGIERYESHSKEKASLGGIEWRLLGIKADVFKMRDPEYATSSSNYFSVEFPKSDSSHRDLDLRVKRNVRWLKKIMDYHFTLDGPVLFAFGASHLCGKMGIISLLQQSEFEIKRINLLGDRVDFPGISPSSDDDILELIQKCVDEYSMASISRSTSLGHRACEIIHQYAGVKLFDQPKFLSEHLQIEETGVIAHDEPYQFKFK